MKTVFGYAEWMKGLLGQGLQSALMERDQWETLHVSSFTLSWSETRKRRVRVRPHLQVRIPSSRAEGRGDAGVCLGLGISLTPVPLPRI